MEHLLVIFQSLSPALQLVAAMGCLMPVLVLWAYLHPPKPKLPKPDGFAMVDGKRANIYMNAQTFDEKKGK